MPAPDRDRDNACGRYVSDDYAARNPDSTTSESTAEGGDRKVYRDDKTGRFVSADYAKEHPGETGVDHV